MKILRNWLDETWTAPLRSDLYGFVWHLAKLKKEKRTRVNENERYSQHSYTNKNKPVDNDMRLYFPYTLLNLRHNLWIQ